MSQTFFHQILASIYFVKTGVHQLVVGADYIKLIWVPDTFFVNEKSAQFHAATQVNTTAVVVNGCIY